MKLNKNILESLKQSVLNQDNTIRLETFAKNIEKVFHNNASVDIDDYQSAAGKIEISVDSSCYQYWNDFVKKYCQTFTFDNIFNDYDTIFKYEDDGYEPRERIQLFGITIIFDELYDISVKYNGEEKTLGDVINFINDELSNKDIDVKVDTIVKSCGDQIAKEFGGISEKEVEFLVYRLIEAL